MFSGALSYPLASVNEFKGRLPYFMLYVGIVWYSKDGIVENIPWWWSSQEHFTSPRGRIWEMPVINQNVRHPSTSWICRLVQWGFDGEQEWEKVICIYCNELALLVVFNCNARHLWQCEQSPIQENHRELCREDKGEQSGLMMPYYLMTPFVSEAQILTSALS